MQRYVKRPIAGLAVFLTLVLLVIATSAAALEVPPLKGHVNDYADMLSPGSRQQLETLLTDFERQDSTQIVVLTVVSLEGDALEDFSIRVADAWKIGQKGTDNGAILLIARNDRKIRIEVGYGLEGRLTDLLAGRIIRNVITPRFKAGDFDQGITAGVTAMIDAVRGEFSGGGQPPSPQPKSQRGTPVVAIIALFFLVNALGRVSRLMGAASGAILAPMAGALFFGFSPLVQLALVPAGLIAGFLISLFGSPLSTGPTTPRGRGGGRGGGSGGYWGGGFGGGGFGGGGFSSGGGFGGFSGGGGGFGGGGASGGW